MINNRKLNYVPAIDGLRGVAILGVMLLHIHFSYPSGAFIGVDIFFVLSGYLITSLLVNEFDRFGSVSLGNFYIRRFLRLAPALILFLLIFCLISMFYLDAEKAHSNYIDALISLFYLSNWAKALDMHAPDLIGHTWSLSVEEQFYIFWPILLLALLRLIKDRRYIALSAFLIALISWLQRIFLSYEGASFNRIYAGLDTRVDGLMIGATIGLILSSGLLDGYSKKSLNKIFTVVTPIAVLLLVTFSLFGHMPDFRLAYYGFFIIELLAAILILDITLNDGSKIKGFLSNKLIVYVGTISYGLYLWHYPIFRTIHQLGYNRTIEASIGFPISFIIAILSYHVMEKQILKLKKYYSNKPL